MKMFLEYLRFRHNRSASILSKCITNYVFCILHLSQCSFPAAVTSAGSDKPLACSSS